MCVYTNLPYKMQAGLARSHFLSPKGQCRPFDVGADGYCRAEGCGIFVLKRLSDALADNDRVLGLIKGASVNQSGKAHSVTHPHGETQMKLLKRVLGQSRVLPHTIGAIEVHGTGTQVGDPVEFSSIATVLGTDRTKSNPLFISSSKGNIGHAEAASGSAGLIKLLMMVSKGYIPLQAGFKTPNPKIDTMLHDGIQIPVNTTKWSRVGNLPRRALLNNFGASGSNACLIVEEYLPPQLSKDDQPSRDTYVFALSAKDRVTFDQRREAIAKQLQHFPQPIQHLSYTSLRRELLETRLILTAKSSRQLLSQLKDTQVEPSQFSVRDSRPRVVLVLSGQGGHYIGMGSQLFGTIDSFRQDVLQCDDLVRGIGYPSILPILQNPKGSHIDSTLTQMHCAAFALQYALTRLWKTWGIVFDAIIGHSIGEYAGFVAAGVLALKDAIMLVANRGRLIEETCLLRRSGMIAVKIGAERLRSILASEAALGFQTASIACDNSPDDCVVSISSSEAGQFSRFLTNNNFAFKKLDVPFGFHSSLMEPLRYEFDQIASKVHLREPTVALGLTMKGQMSAPGSVGQTYFASQTISPVRFRETIQAFAGSVEKRSHIVFLEVGPHPVLLPAIKSSLLSFDHNATYLNSLHKMKNDWCSLTDSVSQLVLQGFRINWQEWFMHQDVRLVDLPLYPFAKKEFQIPHRPEPSQTSSITAGSDLLLVSPRREDDSGALSVYNVDPCISSIIDGHRVAGFRLCPASVYIELAVQAATQRTGSIKALSMKNISFHAPLASQESTPIQPIEVTIDRSSGVGDINFTISPRSFQSTNTLPGSFCSGTIATQPSESQPIPEQMQFARDTSTSSVIRRKILYETIFKRVVAYSPLYQTIDWLHINNSGNRAWGSFRLRQEALFKNCILQPVFIDTLLHAAGFIANCSVLFTELCICTGIKSVTVMAPAPNWSESFKINVQIEPSKIGFSASSYAFDHEGHAVAVIKGMDFKRVPLLNFEKHMEQISKASIRKNIDMRVQREHSKQRLSNSSKGTFSNIIDILQQVTGMSDISRFGDSTLSSLGIDSLMKLELAEKLKIQYPNLDLISNSGLSDCATINDLLGLADIQDDTVIANGSGLCMNAMETFGGINNQCMSELSSTLLTEDSNQTAGFTRKGPIGARPQALFVDSSIEGLVCRAIAEVTGLLESQVNPFSTFEQLGLDSLVLIELCAKLRAEEMFNPDYLNFQSCQTVRDVIVLAEENARTKQTPTLQPSTNTLELLQNGPTSAVPLYLIHDGSGATSMYKHLSSLDRSVYGISAQSPRKYRSISDMAKSYAAMIQSNQPIILGGKCLLMYRYPQRNKSD